MATYNIDKITSPSGDVYKLQDKVSGFTTNTGTVTSVTAGTGLTIGTATSGGSITTTGTINHSNSITAGTAGTSSATSGKTLAVPYITYDAQGHITATGTHTHTVSGFATLTDEGDLEIGTSSDTVQHSTSIKNTNGEVRLLVSANGNHGVYSGFSGTGAGWIIYRSADSSDTKAYIPRSLNVSGTLTADNIYVGTEDVSGAIKNITRSGTTFTATKLDGTTFTFSQQDNNTTYTFTGGTNKFTVTPSEGTAQDVTITPSIANNVTGSGTSGYLAKFNGANTITSGPALGSSTTTYLRNDGTWATPTNTTYSAGTGLSLSGTTFSNSGATGVKGNAETSYRTGNVNLTPANIGALALTGGTLSGAVSVDVASGEARILAKNGVHDIYLFCHSDGRSGIYAHKADGTGYSVINIVNNATTATFYGHASQDLALTGGSLSGSLSVTGNVVATAGVCAGGKGTGSDGKAGSILNTAGHLYMQGASGSHIYFYYGTSTTVTSQLYESASGTLTVSGNWDVTGNLHSTGTITTSGHVSCGGKTSGGDGTTGCFMNNGGSFFITGPANGGGYIYFCYNKATSSTSRIYESSSGTIKVDAALWGKNSSGGLHQVITTNDTATQQVAYLYTNSSALYVNARHGGSSYANKSVTLSSSDVRLKTNITDSTVNALDVINKIRIREFDWTDEREDKYQPIGMVADEIEKLDKRFAVGGGYTEDGCMNIKSVDTFYLTGYLTKGIQELCGKVDGHDDRIAALEKENKELRKEIEELKKEMLTFDAKISYLLDKTR